MSDDPLWPRASAWLAAEVEGDAHLSVLGVPAAQTSISATGADATPAAIREALARYSTYSWSRDVDVASIRAWDAGDVPEPDGPEGEERVMARAAEAASRSRLLVALGGDNSITYAVARGVWGEAIGTAGLITVDAHHDLRDGTSNGSPVRRLVEAGLPGHQVVQIGIADFSNSREYAARARDLGITVVTRDALRRRPLPELIAEALTIAGAGGGPIHVDLDVDVCDRSVVPGCPAAAPGGISADELRQLAFLAARSPRVRSLDITEIDATADAPDGRTVRLGALLVLEAAAGLAERTDRGRAPA
jgi:formiminoglutamase